LKLQPLLTQTRETVMLGRFNTAAVTILDLNQDAAFPPN
jgi:hypothetical protein